VLLMCGTDQLLSGSGRLNRIMSAASLYRPTLIEAIRISPEDDSPRLSFANWLEELPTIIPGMAEGDDACLDQRNGGGTRPAIGSHDWRDGPIS
jgi:hypothetical protein